MDHQKAESADEFPVKRTTQRKKLNENEKVRRSKESPLERYNRLKKKRDYENARRSKESPKERETRLKKMRENKTARQKKESSMERDIRLKKKRDNARIRRQKESQVQREIRLKRKRQNRNAKQKKESPMERELRLKKKRDSARASRQKKSPLKRDVELEKEREPAKSKSCSESDNSKSEKNIEDEMIQMPVKACVQDSKISTKCGICVLDEVDSFFLPCGHAHSCCDCSVRWTSQHASKCPLCNEEVTAVIQWSTQRRCAVVVRKQQVDVTFNISVGDDSSCVVCGSDDDEELLAECLFCHELLHQSCGRAFRNGTLCISCAGEDESDGLGSDSEYVPSEPHLKKRKIGN